MIMKTLSITLLALSVSLPSYMNMNDNSTVDPIEVVEKAYNESDSVVETFTITSVENGIIKGEMINGKGEGIYYNLNELDNADYDVFSVLDVNDIVRLEWTEENYNEGNWLDIESVTFNKSIDNKEGKQS